MRAEGKSRESATEMRGVSVGGGEAGGGGVRLILLSDA